MKHVRAWTVGAVVFLLAAVAVRAEITITVERNQGARATPDFKFDKVPSPAKDNAAIKARVTIVDGTQDSNGADVGAVNDGQLPQIEDDPPRNFFFDAGTEGGRFAMDLGRVMSIKQVNSYSWHSNTRAAQVYKLYASDGTAKDFMAAPKIGTDPTKVGWKLVATVDTRPKAGELTGGQYGVSIADAKDVIGRYRYLLFDVSRTEADDAWGNTFFSEITVIEQR